MVEITSRTHWIENLTEKVSKIYKIDTNKKDDLISVVKKANKQIKAKLPVRINDETLITYAGRVARFIGYGDNYRQPKCSKKVASESRRKLGESIKSVAYRNYETKKLGKFGAASSCRRIDPKTGEYI